MTTAQSSRSQVKAVTYLPSPGHQMMERLITLLLVLVGPTVGVLAAVMLLGRPPRLVEVALFFVFYVLTIGGVTAGYHRLFTHKSYEASRPLQIALAIAGGMACQGSLHAWVADHRRHHLFSDSDGDPHSPYFGWVGGGWRRFRGLLHAHFGWFFAPERTDPEHYIRDLSSDQALRRVSQLFPLWVVLSLALPAVVGWLVGHTWQAAFGGFLWGGPVRLFLAHHVTWSVNSVCHTFGRRPFKTEDKSTNNWWLSLPSLGEAWHNCHHKFPRSARHGLLPGQIDLTFYFIKLMGRVGLVKSIHVPSSEKIASALNLTG